MRYLAAIAVALSVAAGPLAQSKPGLAPKDLFQLQSVGDVQLSSAGTHLAYSVTHSDRPGRPYSNLAIRDLATGQVRQVKDGSGVRWSPDGK